MTGDPLTAMSPNALQRRIEGCRICYERPTQPQRLPHVPRPVLRISDTARLCIAGQAPGARVHASGLPFDDRSGDRLREWMGVARDEFYDERLVSFVPMGFCFPGYDAKGSDMPPRRECRATWHDRVFAVMPQVELVLAIGAYAQRYHLGDRARPRMTETVLDWRAHLFRNERPRVLPLPHPSWRNTGWLRANPWFEADVVPALRREVGSLLTPTPAP